MSIRILTGDCRETLKTLRDQSVHCCVTSPPYFGLRDYGVDGQIGLEQTPDEYVAEMVAVFREVRRVLRDDGTLWLNLGDSYGGTAGNTAMTGGKSDKARGEKIFGGAKGRDKGGRPKDLIGIPWRVAFALQRPWYSGRITKETDRMWLAAMIDGEGCMFIHKRKAGTDSGAKFTKADGTEVSYARKQDTYSPGLEVANTHLGIVERCQQITGLGTITRQDKDRRLPLYRWHLRADEARQIVREVYPYLIGKRQQARILCGCPTNGDQAEAAHQALMLLHNGSLTDVDFKDPASMHEPGWYLRQDVIWSKPNPMPESVRDRCTKAHEYVFLLSKSARYFFDAEAIAEAASVGFNGSSFVSEYDLKTKSNLGRGERNDSSTRNKRSVWSIPTQPFSEAHFATMAPELAETCIKAGCPKDGTVLDPFGGAGTTGLCADRLNRNAVLIELNPEYVQIAKRRLEGDAGMFAEVVA